MTRFSLLLVLALGCTVDSTGLLPADDAGLRDTASASDANPNPDASTEECTTGMSRACEGIGACQNRRQECEGGVWAECIETVFPETPEACDSGNVDEDCDGTSNEGCGCTEDMACGISATPPCRMGVLRCIDGVLSEVCEGAVMPVAETCNGVDDNCNSEIDEGVKNTYFTDNDGDEVGTEPAIMECELPATGFAEEGGDCNDGDDEVYPGNIEICDGKDNDCDASTNEDAEGMTYYLDTDEDEYGDPATAVTRCADPGEGYVTIAGDCAVMDPDINPDADEECDLVDNNCSGTPDDGETCRGGCVARTFGGHVYQFCPENRNWGEAEDRCEDMSGNNSGLYVLVTIDDMAENVFLSEAARSVSDGGWWIGFTDAGGGNEGSFRWVSGSDSSYTNWADGEPNDGDSITVAEDCTELRGSGAWNDERCWNDRHFICEQAD